jgi:hypothetical protein
MQNPIIKIIIRHIIMFLLSIYFWSADIFIHTAVTILSVPSQYSEPVATRHPTSPRSDAAYIVGVKARHCRQLYAHSCGY